MTFDFVHFRYKPEVHLNEPIFLKLVQDADIALVVLVSNVNWLSKNVGGDVIAWKDAL